MLSCSFVSFALLVRYSLSRSATDVDHLVTDITPPRPDLERRGSMCPDCGVVRGDALKLSFASWIRTITYQCPGCGRTWEHATPEYKPSNHEEAPQTPVRELG
jgi:hypothetical protein